MNLASKSTDLKTKGSHPGPAGAFNSSRADGFVQRRPAALPWFARAAQGLVQRQTDGADQSPAGDGDQAISSGADLASQLSTSSTITCDFGQGRVFCTFRDINHALDIDDCEQVAIDTYQNCIKTGTNRSCLARVRCAVCQCVGPKLCSCTGMI